MHSVPSKLVGTRERVKEKEQTAPLPSVTAETGTDLAVGDRPIRAIQEPS